MHRPRTRGAFSLGSTMKAVSHYSPPAAADLLQLKKTLGYSSTQMASAAGLSQGAHWRKYQGGEQPRSLSLHSHFYLAAQLLLDDAQLEQIYQLMREQGAEVELLNLDALRGLSAAMRSTVE